MSNTKSWQGDWYRRVLDGVASAGFPSVMAFAAGHPTWTYRQLAEALGPDIVPVHVEWIERKEAMDTDRFRDFAASNLVRTLRECMPEGWGRGDKPDFRVAHSFGTWGASLGANYPDDIVLGAAAALKKSSVPTGWLPTGPDDPLIVAALCAVELKKPAR
jgi:hypothetical protein